MAITLIIIRAIENDGHMLVLLLFIESVKFGQHRSLEQTGAHNKNRTVGKLIKDLCIGNDLNRRTVII